MLHSLSRRTTALIAAAVAAVLLAMQLSREGAAGYELGDVLSIVVAVLPVVLHGARPQPPRRRPLRVVEDGEGEAAAHGDGPADDAPPAVDATAGVLQRVAADGAGWVLAVGAWVLAVGLAFLQAWPAVLSAGIIFLVAGTAVTPAAARDEVRVGDRPGPG